MSDSIGRFVSLVGGDAVEAGARAFMNTPDQPHLRPPRQPRQPRMTPSLGKQEHLVATSNPSPEEVQASLDTALARFIDQQPTPERKAEVLIKIGSYQFELSKYAPMLAEADPDIARETLEVWFAEGDRELKKALVNAGTGTEDFPLLKSAPAEGPEVELARMVDAAETPERRAALLQKMTFYGTQLNEMLDRGALLKIDPASIEAAIADWIASGDDHSHQPMKKALADAATEARRQAAMDVGENEAVKFKVGNASSAAAAQLSGQNDRTYVPRSTGAGAGARMSGAQPAPNQTGETGVAGSSGPNDTGDGGVKPAITIRRATTTGGVGSVAGAPDNVRMDTGNDIISGGNGKSDDLDPKTGKPRKKPAKMDKTGDLGIELIKIAPQPMVEALSKMSPDAQVDLCELAAQNAADLMAWSTQQDPATLQKSALDAAIRDWLQEDPSPATVQLKKWVAEALASAEEIPLGLGKAIMAWDSPAVTRVTVRRARAA
jgi:hypothetical protein